MSNEEEDAHLDIKVPAVVERRLASFSAPMRVCLPFITNQPTVGGVRPLNSPHHIQVVLVCDIIIHSVTSSYIVSHHHT